MSLMDLQDMHPLRDQVKIEHILPFLKICFKKRKPDFKNAVRKAILSEMGLKKVPKSWDELAKEPFLRLGFGIIAYFDVMLNLVWMFLAISFFSLPLFYYY